MEGINLIGTSGATVILVAFILNQLGFWKSNSLKYDAVNFIGGVLLVFYAFKIDSYPFAVLNGVWALVSLRDVFIDIKKRKFVVK
ncbi:MAG: hypothetical protein AAB390_03425 [Patescibacteria group bacterium]